MATVTTTLVVARRCSLVAPRASDRRPLDHPASFVYQQAVCPVGEATGLLLPRPDGHANNSSVSFVTLASIGQ